MKHKKYDGGFLLGLLFNMLLNIRWTLPAWILLAAYFIFKISIWWFVGALAVWVIGVAIKTAVFSWLVHVGNIPDPPKENKNPYSSKGYKPNK